MSIKSIKIRGARVHPITKSERVLINLSFKISEMPSAYF